MKHIGMAAIAACMLACGAAPEEFEGSEELRILEQAASTNGGHGFRTDVAGSNTRCIYPAPAGQVCVLPPDKALTFRVTTTGLTASQRAELEGYIDTGDLVWPPQFPTYTFTRLASGAGTADVNIRGGSLGGGPTTSIHTYAKITSVNSPVDLDDQGLSGLWRKYGNLTCTIDMARIDSDFTSLQRPNVRAQAAWYCQTKGMGLGSGAHFIRPDAIATTPNDPKNLNFSAKSKCFANNYNPSAGVLTVGTACNAASD